MSCATVPSEPVLKQYVLCNWSQLCRRGAQVDDCTLTRIDLYSYTVSSVIINSKTHNAAQLAYNVTQVSGCTPEAKVFLYSYIQSYYCFLLFNN